MAVFGSPLPSFFKGPDTWDVVQVHQAILGAYDAINYVHDLLLLIIAERDARLSVPSLGFFLPGGGRIPDMDTLQAALQAASIDGLEAAADLISGAFQPSMVRHFITRKVLSKVKGRTSGRFTNRNDFTNQMSIRIPHR